MSSNPGKLRPAGNWSAHPSPPGDDRGQEGRSRHDGLSATVERVGERGEPYGSVEITRYEKQDGRSLLLYSHRERKRDS